MAKEKEIMLKPGYILIAYRVSVLKSYRVKWNWREEHCDICGEAVGAPSKSRKHDIYICVDCFQEGPQWASILKTKRDAVAS